MELLVSPGAPDDNLLAAPVEGHLADRYQGKLCSKLLQGASLFNPGFECQDK